MTHPGAHRGRSICRTAFFVLLFAPLAMVHAEPQDVAAELSPGALVANADQPEAEAPLIETEHTISLARLRNAPPPQAVQKLSDGWDAFQNGDYEAAVDKLRRALDIHPKFIQAHNNLGYIYWQEGRLGEAIQEFEAAVSVDPSWTTSLVNLALAYYAQGRFDEALTMAHRAVKANPASARAHYAAGLILLDSEAGKAQALEHFREASSDFPKAQLMEAYMMLRLNRPEQARETLHAYLMRTPLR